MPLQGKSNEGRKEESRTSVAVTQSPPRNRRAEQGRGGAGTRGRAAAVEIYCACALWFPPTWGLLLGEPALESV